MFSRPFVLKIHIQRIHEKEYNCDKCVITFDHPFDLLDHRKTAHKDEESHQCSQCNKSFKSAKKLRKHVSEVHDGVKRFQCNLCDMAFGQSGTLKRHLESIHEKLRKYKCNFCVKDFNTDSVLTLHLKKMHQLIHKCKLCNTRFTSARDLASHHQKLHGKHYEFQCGTCSKGFETEAELTLHTELGVCQRQASSEIQGKNCNSRQKL